MVTTRLDDAMNAIREATAAEIEAAYNRGKADAKAEILALLSAGGASAVKKPQDVDTSVRSGDNDDDYESDEELEDHGRKRAPRGLPRALAERVLAVYRNEGCTPSDILEHAETDYEKMIKLSSIRSELRKGEQEGRYREHGGIWFLTDGNGLDELLG